MNPRLVWPVVVLVGIGATAATIMALAGVDTSAITSIMALLVVPVLGAILAAKQGETGAVVQQVKEQTNGTMGRLVDIIERQGAMLAATTPPVPAEQPEQRAA